MSRWERYLEGRFEIPATDAFGFKVEEVVDPTEAVEFSWKVPAEYCNSAGNLQGGVLAAFADALLGGAAAAHLPDDTYAALAEMKISIFRPAPAGATLTGRGYVVKAGARVLFVEAEITDDSDQLVAKASGTEIPAKAGD